MTASKDEAARVLSQLKRVVRANYSNPPTHGGQIVATVLDVAGAARAVGSRARRHARPHQADAREAGASACSETLPGRDFRYMLTQRGMFSYSGLTKDAGARLRDEYSIYAVDTGRICVAALNSRNVDYVADAIARVAADSTAAGSPLCLPA